MAEPSVAVIVPLLNEIGMLPVMAEQWRRLAADELLIVDGGSTDGSLEYLQGSGLRWLASGMGRAVQMNAGAAHSRSDIIVFIHADTSINSSRLSEVRQAFLDPETVAGRFDIRLEGKQPLLRVVERLINWRSRLTRISTGDQAMFVRRDVFERIGGFADQPLMEDVELSKRLKREGRIACLRQRVTTSGRRWEKQGAMRTILLMWWLRLLYWLGVSPERLAAMYREVR